jgi:hypothetical protein
MTTEPARRAERSASQRERMQRKYDRARFANLFGNDALPAITSCPPPFHAPRKDV